MTRILPVAFTVLVLASGPGARAAPPTESEQARKHFEAGSKAFNLGEFKRAIEEYKAAYNVKADPVFLYNIAQAYRLDNNLQQSLFFYKSYLVNSPKAPNRREVEERIHKLEVQLNEQRALTSMPPNAPVAPGSTSGDPEPSTTVASRTEPRTTQSTTTQPTTTEPHTTTTPTTTSGTSGALTATASAKKEPIYKKWWLWTVVGVGVVGIGLGVGLGVGMSGGPPSSNLGATRVF